MKFLIASLFALIASQGSLAATSETPSVSNLCGIDGPIAMLGKVQPGVSISDVVKVYQDGGDDVRTCVVGNRLYILAINKNGSKIAVFFNNQ